MNKEEQLLLLTYVHILMTLIFNVCMYYVGTLFPKTKFFNMCIMYIWPSLFTWLTLAI